MPYAPIRSRGELPQLFKDGCWHFVTARLWDAVDRRNTIESIETSGDESEANAFTQATAHDAPITLGECYLACPDIAAIVQDALRHFDGQRYILAAWCIMPNHMHLVIMPLGNSTLATNMHSIKSFTAHKANKVLNRSGPLWQRESFNHLVRSGEDLERFIRYTENNPVEAELCNRAQDWRFGSAHWKDKQKCAGGTPAPQ